MGFHNTDDAAQCYDDPPPLRENWSNVNYHNIIMYSN